MAKVLGLEEMPKEEFARRQFKTPEEAVAVIDMLQTYNLIDGAVSSLIHAKPDELTFLDETARRKLRSVAGQWAASFDLRLQIKGVQLGLFADGPEFIEQAFALLQDDYQYLPDPDDIRYDLEQISFILWKDHIDRLNPQQRAILRTCLRNNVFLPVREDIDEEVTAPVMPLTGRAAKVMPVAEQEACRLNHSYIGTEHILLALARQNDAVSAKVLANLGADLDTLRAEVNKFVRPGDEPVVQRTLPCTVASEHVIQVRRRGGSILRPRLHRHRAYPSGPHARAKRRRGSRSWPSLGVTSAASEDGNPEVRSTWNTGVR